MRAGVKYREGCEGFVEKWRCAAMFVSYSLAVVERFPLWQPGFARGRMRMQRRSSSPGNDSLLAKPIQNQQWPQKSSIRNNLRLSSLWSFKMPSRDCLEFCQSTKA